jgi:hypothetical protein
MYKYLRGTSYILCGTITCPIVCAGSCLFGFGLTLSACSNCCQCFNDDFIKEREKVCTYCGVGTSLEISYYMCRKGYNELTVEYDMIR